MATIERPNALGEVLTPGDDGYDGARRIWNGLVDRRPAFIARPRTSTEVAAAILHARAHDLEVAVRCGGHSVAGHSTVDGGLVIDLSVHLGHVAVDPAARRARAGGGALLGALDRATQQHGFVVPSGHVSHTGVGGLTLGGGTGWLMRRYGLTIDSLLSAQVVTADGEVVRASEEEHADLFWALRGGGGNFGVVTEFEFRVHALGQELVAGMLVYPLDKARDVLAFTRDWMDDAPEELTTFPVLVTAPPSPPFPPALHGQPILAVGVAYAGPLDEGMRVLEPLKRFARPSLDLAAPMPYLRLQTMLDAGAPHGLHNYNRAEWLDELTDAAIDVVVGHAERFSSPLSQIILARMGGAVASVAPEETAFAHRRARNLLWIVAAWRPDEDPNPHLAWAGELSSGAKRHAAGGVYVNALGDEPERVRMAYGVNWEPLREIKRRYDPENFFHRNANIPPAPRTDA